MTTTNVALPNVVTRAEWLLARRELLAREKELTRALYRKKIPDTY